MKKKITIITVLLLTTLVVLSINIWKISILEAEAESGVLWRKTFGGSDVEGFYDVDTTLDGGYIAVGISYSNDIDLKGFDNVSGNAIIVKYDKTGNVQWIRNFGGSEKDIFNSVKSTDDGGFIVVGYSNSTDIEIENPNVGSTDAIIIKYNDQGDMIWAKNFGGNGNEEFNSISITSNGEYIAVGGSDSSDGDLSGLNKGFSDGILVKYNRNGDVLWTNTFGGTGIDHIVSVDSTSDGGCVVVGEAASNDFDLNGLNKGEMDGVIVKYDSLGNLEWKNNFGGNDTDCLSYVKVSKDNGYIAVGYSYSIDDNLGLSNYGSSDCVIVKYDSSGNILWKKNFGGSSMDTFFSVENTDDDGYIAIGSTLSNDFDMENKLKDTKQSLDGVIVKYDNNGNKLWDKVFGSNNNGFDEIEFLSVIVKGYNDDYVIIGNSTGNDIDLYNLNKGKDDAIIFNIKDSCILPNENIDIKPATWINQDVVATIKTDNEYAIDWIKDSNNIYANAKGGLIDKVYSENGTYSYLMQDMNFNQKIITVNINNIDKEVPKAPTISKEQNTFTVLDHGDVGKSGVKEIQYRVNGRAWEVYASPVSFVNGINSIEAKVIDNAGNQSDITNMSFNYEGVEVSFSVDTIDFGELSNDFNESTITMTISSSSDYNIDIIAQEDFVNTADNVSKIPISNLIVQLDGLGFKSLIKGSRINLLNNSDFGENVNHTLGFKVNSVIGFPVGIYEGNVDIEISQN